MSKSIIFEQPLNERIRTLLRLEFLFTCVRNALAGTSEIQHRNAIDAMLSILSVFERGDMKQKLIKEIERIISNRSALELFPDTDQPALENLLIDLEQNLDALYRLESGIGQTLKENDFLFSIRQHSNAPGGTCGYALPGYHYWLQHATTSKRRRQLNNWLNEFSPAKNALDIILNLIRNSVGFSNELADDGFFQCSLNTRPPHQLIRIKLPADVSYYPEISGGKHRITIRFMEFSLSQRPQQSQLDIPFKLSCCIM